MDWRGFWELQEVISSLADRRNVELALVSRKSKMAADWIAVNCGKGVSPIGWVNIPPPHLVRILEIDAKVEEIPMATKMDEEGGFCCEGRNHDRSGIG